MIFFIKGDFRRVFEPSSSTLSSDSVSIENHDDMAMCWSRGSGDGAENWWRNGTIVPETSTDETSENCVVESLREIRSFDTLDRADAITPEST